MPLFEVAIEGVVYEVDAPDKNTAWRWANTTHAQRRAEQAQVPAAPKESTIGSELVRGARQLLSTSRTGIGALLNPETAALAGLERGERIAADAGEGPSLAAVRKAYEERGLLPAAGEAISQIPRALAGQVAPLATMAAGARAGAALGSVIPGVGTIGGGIAGAGLTLLPQFFGANVERQAQEQVAEGTPVDINRTAAGAAAVGQAGLEAAGTALVLGKRLVKGILGVQDDAALATAKAQAELVKTAQQSLMASVGRGAARGTAAIPMEVAQAIIERAQAGLELTSPEALAEYGENAYLAGLVGPTLGGIAAPVERGMARSQVARQEQAEAEKQAAAAREAEQKRRADPAFLEGLNTTYQDLLTQKSALEAQIKKGSKEAPLSQEDKDANAVIVRQLSELRQPLERARQEFINAGGPQALAKLRAGRLELTPPPGRVSEPPPDEAPADEVETPEAQRARLTRETQSLTALLEQQRVAVQQAPTPEAAAEAAARAQKTYDALTEANAKLAELPKAPSADALKKREKALLKKYEAAREAGDQAAVLKLVPELQQVRAQLQEAQPFDLAAPEYAAEEQRKSDLLGDAMGAGREDAAGNRQLTDLEQQAAREEEARNAQRQQQLELEGWAEGEVARERAEETERQASLEATGRLREASQLDMFPEARQRVVRQQAEVPANERPMAVGRLRAELAKLLRDKRALEREAAQARPAPGAELSGPASLPVIRTEERMRALDTRIAEIEEELTALTAPAVETRTTAVRPDEPQPDTRQTPLQQRLNTLAERVLASPRVDEDTKALVREVQDNLPLLMQRDENIGAWLYRTLQGTAPDDLTQNVRDRLAELDTGRRSETEPVTERVRRPLTAEERRATAGTSLQGQRTIVQPQASGEVRSGAQLELEMPEPRATEFATLKEFQDYLASDTLAAKRSEVGPTVPTAERLERELAPLRAQAARFRDDQQLLDASAAALRQYVPDVVRTGKAVSGEQQALNTAMGRLSDANTQALAAAQALLDNQQAFLARVEAAQDGEVTDADFKRFLVAETKLYFDLQQSLRRVAGFKSQVTKHRRLVNLAQLEQQADATAAPGERRAEFSSALSKTKAQAAGALERQVREQEAAAKQRAEAGAERRQPATFAPSGDTLSQREARTGQERAAEQARLEREAAGAGTRIEFEPKTELDISQDRNYRVLLERAELAKTREERAAALKAAEEYFNARAANLDKAIKDAVRNTAGHLEKLDAAKARLKHLQERLEKNVTEKGRQMTPRQRAKVEKDIEDTKGSIETHQKNYNNSASEVRVKRTDIKAEREAKQQLLADVRARFEPGQRLGEVEGTTAGRAIGPVTRPEVTPPVTMMTGSEESRAGLTTTGARSRLTEARGTKQRDVAMTAKEMKEAQAAAAKMKTLEGLEQAEKALAAEREAASARGLRPGEFDRFEAREAVLKARRAALEAKKPAAAKPAEPPRAAPEQEVEPEAEPPKKRGRKAAAVEEMEEELDAFEPEILPGTDEDVFFKQQEAAYDARDETTLDMDTRQAVQDGDLRSALASLAEKGSTEFVRTLAKRLEPLVLRTKLEVRDDVLHKGVSVQGLYMPPTNTVLLHRDALSEEVLTHELTHAATLRALLVDQQTLSPEQRRARQEIEALYDAIKKQPDFAREYGTKNVYEFVAELMSDTRFRNKLDKQKPGFLRRIYNAFLRMLGMPPLTTSQKAVENAYRLFMPSKSIKAAAAPSVQRGNTPTAARVADKIVGQQDTWRDKLRKNLLGGGFRMQFIDRLDPVEDALNKGGVEKLKADQARFYLRMADQTMHFTSQAIHDGAPTIVEKTRRDGRTERLIESAPGASIKKVTDILFRKDVVKEAGGPDNAKKMFTLYMAAIRGENVGYEKLNFGRDWASSEIGRIDDELASPRLSPETRTNLQKQRTRLQERMKDMPSKEDIKAAKAELDANPVLNTAFTEARDIYNAYNRNLMQFVIDTGAIGKDLGARLLASNDYVPYYRVRDGVASMMIGGETPIRIGNLKDSPHLQELVGGDEAIFDFLTSSVQNTSMLLDMSMRNLAVKNLMYELRDVGLAKISKTKNNNSPTGSVTFKRDGEEYHAVVDTDAIGVSSELLVKGLAGIPTMLPALVRAMGVPARWLRRLVVASPVYMARQLVRDSTQAAIASGANMVPVLSSLRQIGNDGVLERRGITGGMVFTGLPEDQARLLQDIQSGKISLSRGLTRLEALSAQIDAMTREAQYKSYREQGLSEMESTLMALESMNFSRRGVSPTMHMLSTMLPFFNAQIQGLDVLYRSARGEMPFNEQLAVRKKILTRGAMLFGLSMLYATLMQDEEAYKNAKVEEKYGNFFVPVPGTEQILRVPIPFELGYIFKALPEALVNIAMNEEGGEEAVKALTFIAKQTVPGLSSYFLPQAVKPALEVALDQSIFTGRDIESAQEKLVESGLRYRDSTTELAKEVGELTGVSPIKMEYLIRGYTGSMGMALVQLASVPFSGGGPEGPTKRPSDVPLVGTLFQPTDASSVIDAVYERMNKARQAQETYEALINKGRPEEAQAYIAKNLDDIAFAPLAGRFRQQMGEITKYERAVRASTFMTPQEKREALDQARQAKIRLAKAVREGLGRTERQAAPA